MRNDRTGKGELGVNAAEPIVSGAPRAAWAKSATTSRRRKSVYGLVLALACSSTALADEADQPSPAPIAPTVINEGISTVADAFSAGDALIVQGLEGNNVTTNSHALAAIEQSFNSNAGIVGVNQLSGEGGNQINLTLITLTETPGTNYTSGQVARTSSGNSVSSTGSRTARVIDSFNDSQGITAINQAAGHLNQQANAFLLTVSGSLTGPPAPSAFAVPGLTPLSDSTLALQAADVISPDNKVESADGPGELTIEGSFNDYSGVAQVSRAAGHLNQTTNIMGISVTRLGGGP